MGRNGKQAPVFPEIVKFINNNVGKVVGTKEILLGKSPGRNSETAYLYKFIKLGYVEPANGQLIKDTEFKIIKSFPISYNSVMLKAELKQLAKNN